MKYYANELYHHGILGQKWGVRRYQNPDGTLTEEGKKRHFDRYTEGQKIRSSTLKGRIRRNMAINNAKPNNPWRKGPLSTREKAEVGLLKYEKKMEKVLTDLEKVKDEKKRYELALTIFTKDDEFREHIYNTYKNYGLVSKKDVDNGYAATNRLMREVGEKYTMTYNVATGEYSLHEKVNNADRR